MEKIPDVIHESWHKHLQPLFNDYKMQLIKTDLLPNCKFYPEGPKIFRVFSLPLEKIKVVILGQDPYPNGEAVGLAFGVKATQPMPSSLRIISKEIERSGLKTGFFDSDIPQWRTLEHWHEQGVFLLNTALTVEAKNAGSHIGQWQWFTREVIKIISREVNPVWLLWGDKAKAFKDYIINERFHGKVFNYFEASHPAAETYSGFKGKPFSGCNHFNLCNEILIQKDQTIINW